MTSISIAKTNVQLEARHPESARLREDAPNWAKQMFDDFSQRYGVEVALNKMLSNRLFFNPEWIVK